MRHRRGSIDMFVVDQKHHRLDVVGGLVGVSSVRASRQARRKEMHTQSIVEGLSSIFKKRRLTARARCPSPRYFMVSLRSRLEERDGHGVACARVEEGTARKSDFVGTNGGWRGAGDRLTPNVPFVFVSLSALHGGVISLSLEEDGEGTEASGPLGWAKWET